MPNPSESPHAHARRALIEDIQQDRTSWLRHGVAALAVSLLGLGVAGSVTLTGTAQHTVTSTEPEVAIAATTTGSETSRTGQVAGPAVTTGRSLDTTSRSITRPAIDAAKVKSLADQRAEELSKSDDQIGQVAQGKAAQARDQALAANSDATSAQAKLLSERRAVPPTAPVREITRPGSPATPQAPTRPVVSGAASCLPITGGYSIAARFGQIGPWARYHTGFDFADPIGTPVRAPGAGVVTNAGTGPAGWAGNYVAIRYPDGTQTLMAHMSTVSVSVGQTVSACQVVGAIGMTGRTFGPHVHFEVYPAGVTPGDVYRAVNPVGWLNARGLRP